MKREVIYEGHIVNLVKLEDRWEAVEHAPAVIVLAVKADRVLGVEQQRPVIGGVTWELPAGLVDEGESPADAAARELAEEVQVSADLRLLTQVYTSPGFTDEKIYLFEANRLQAVDGEQDEGEDITVVWRDLKTTWDEIGSGKIATSAPTALALAYALGRLGKL